MIDYIDKIISCRNEYGDVRIGFYLKGVEIHVEDTSKLDKRLQKLIEIDSNMLKNNLNLMRITSKV